jgi:competence protein ComEC
MAPDIADWRVARRLWCELHSLPTWILTIPWRALLVLGEIGVISLCVEVVFVIFMAESFHRLSPISPLLNIPVSVVATIVIPLAMLTVILPRPLAHFVALIITRLLHGILALLGFTLRLPGASLRVPSMPLWIWLIYGISVGVMAWTIRSRRYVSFLGATLAVVFLQIAVAEADLPAPIPNDTTITFIDVGQGDSILIEVPDGKRMLVDGGGVTAGWFLGLRDEITFSIGENVVSPFLWSKGVRKLDVIALTHTHNDHIDGLLNIINNFRTGELWLGRNSMVSPYRELLRRAMEKQIPVRWIATGDTILFLPFLSLFRDLLSFIL